MATLIRRVLAAVRPQQKGLPPAAAHARVLAERFGAELILSTAVYDSSVAVGASRGNARAVAARDGMVEAEKTSLERLAHSLRDWGVGVEIDVRWQTPAFDAVLSAVRERRVDIVVVDALETRPSLHTRLTDADWQLMRLCPCPVLFVNDPEFAAYDDILAAVDPFHEGPHAQSADRAVLTLAKAFAAAFDSRLSIVHAYPDPDDFSWVSSVEVKPGIFYGPENFERLHREAVEELVAGFGIGAEHVALAPGDPRVVIPEVARKRHTQLLVLGALERGAFEQAMLGSTAEAVSAEASCDVLLVKPTALRGPVSVR